MAAQVRYTSVERTLLPANFAAGLPDEDWEEEASQRVPSLNGRRRPIPDDSEEGLLPLPEPVDFLNKGMGRMKVCKSFSTSLSVPLGEEEEDEDLGIEGAIPRT